MLFRQRNFTRLGGGDSLTALMKYAKDKRLAILLCMDSNCHSSSFGTDDNKRGEVLDDFIAAHNLKIEKRH